MIDFNCFDNNFFVKKLYPNGINSSIVISSVVASYRMHSEFNFIAYEKPSIEIKKWGVWGVDYNSVLFETSANSSPIELKINNMKDIGRQIFSINKNTDGNIEVTQLSNDSNLYLVIDGLIIQKTTPLKDY